MRIPVLLSLILLALSLCLLPLLPACGGGGDDEPPPLARPSPTDEPRPTDVSVTVTIGNHTDKTGVAANAMQYIDMALKDTVDYYNENNIIPGVELRLVEYDGQADPSRDLPGYEWLRERGADVITAWFPAVAMTLRSTIEEDGVPLFGTIVRREVLNPPGHLFLTSSLLEDTAWTMIKWIMENDWDYRTNGPARVGGVCWETDDCDVYFEAFRRYEELHPEQIEFVSGHVTPVSTFQYGIEVEALKDCDYVWVPNIMGNFAREYRQAGGRAKLMGCDNQLAFWRMINDMQIWEEIDGALFISMTRWWNDPDEMIDFTNQLLEEKHSGSAEEIRGAGKAYISVGNAVMILDIVKSAAETVGPENVNSQAIYEAAQSFSMTVDGLERFSFSETKRTVPNYLTIYRADADAQNIVRAADWIPVESPE